MYQRKTHTGVLRVFAECHDCGWSSEAANALGNAARHADAEEHEVHVEQTIGILYNRKDPDKPKDTPLPLLFGGRVD